VLAGKGESGNRGVWEQRRGMCRSWLCYFQLTQVCQAALCGVCRAHPAEQGWPLSSGPFRASVRRQRSLCQRSATRPCVLRLGCLVEPQRVRLAAAPQEFKVVGWCRYTVCGARLSLCHTRL